MLGSKPAAFASTAQRVAAVQSIASHPSSVQRQNKVTESLWHICTANAPASLPCPTEQAAEAAPPQAAEAALAETAALADSQQYADSCVVPEGQHAGCQLAAAAQLCAACAAADMRFCFCSFNVACFQGLVITAVC